MPEEIDVRFSVRYHDVMKSFSITALRADAYGIVGEVAQSGEEVLLTSKGKVIAKVVPLDDEGIMRPSFVKELERRLREDKNVSFEEVLKELW